MKIYLFIRANWGKHSFNDVYPKFDDWQTFFYSDNLNSESRNGPYTNMEETKENVYWTVQGTFVDNYARCHRHFSDVVKMRKSNFILNDLCLLNHKYKKIFNSIYKVTFSVFKNRKSTVEICLSCGNTIATIALSYMFFVYAKYFIRYLKRTSLWLFYISAISQAILP